MKKTVVEMFLDDVYSVIITLYTYIYIYIYIHIYIYIYIYIKEKIIQKTYSRKKTKLFIL